MTTTEFQALVKEMRQAQIDYFRTRDKDCLNAARRLEKRVDKALEEPLSDVVLTEEMRKKYGIPDWNEIDKKKPDVWGLQL